MYNKISPKTNLRCTPFPSAEQELKDLVFFAL